MQFTFLDPASAVATASLIEKVILPLPYYNARAKAAELAKHRPEVLLSMIAADPCSVLVAMEAGKPVGFVVSEVDDGLVWLAWFGVDPDARRKGLGALLLGELEKTVRPRGCHKIWCDSRTENTVSAGVLARAGYSRITELKNHWYGQDFYLWEKGIPADGPSSIHLDPSPAGNG